jgi:hypothetical protein
MGQTKRLYGQMELDELLTHFFNHTDGDDDYQYQEYRDKQLQAEQEGYELHFQDKYVNG